jgi:hypothetical protein
MHERMTITPELRIFGLEPFNELQKLHRRVCSQRRAKELIETFSARIPVHARLHGLEWRQT